MLYEFSESLNQIKPEQLNENLLTTGVVKLSLLKGKFGAHVGFGPGLIEECEKTEGRFRSAVDISDGVLFAIVSVREISEDNDARDRVGLFVKKNLMLIVSLRDDDESIPVTLDEMVYHCRCVSRGVSRALLVGDLPFMSYQVSIAQALEAAGRMLKEGGVSAVKLEGGADQSEVIAASGELTVARLVGPKRLRLVAEQLDAQAAFFVDGLNFGVQLRGRPGVD